MNLGIWACYLKVEGPSLRTGECPSSPLALLVCQPADDDDDDDDDDDGDDDDDSDDDDGNDGLSTWPVCTPLLSRTRAASASSASAWQEKVGVRIKIRAPPDPI